MMAEDKMTEKRQALQSVRVTLATDIRPQIMAMRLEIESLETQFNRIGESSEITTEDNFSTEDILSIIEMMQDNCALLMRELEDLREVIEETLLEQPPPRGKLCVVIEHCYSVLNFNMRGLSSTNKSSAVVMNRWLSNLEDDIREIPTIKALKYQFDSIFEKATALMQTVETIATQLSDEFQHNKRWCRE